ncbi:MAG: hypothetical protein ABI472_16345 [Ginsengibacter sp.]
MSRFNKKKKEEIGLAPDDLVFRGDQKEEEVLIRIIDFDANNMKEDALKTINEIKEYQDENTVTWLNIDGLHNTAIMEEIGSVFHLDNLVMAEVVDTGSRPKIIEYDNCTLISIKNAAT